MEAGRWVITIDNGINGCQKHSRVFLVARHDDNSLWCRAFIEHGLDPLRTSDIIRNELIDTKQPGDREETSKGPESEPLKERDHDYWEVPGDLGW